MNLSYSAPSLSPTQLNRMKNINLNSYYKNDLELHCTVHCKICEFDMPRIDVFEHTISKRHKYNKVLVAIVQGCSRNADTDFVILDTDKLRCRYCHSVMINSGGNDLVISHMHDAGHLEKKQDCLNGISAGNFTDERNSLKPLDSLIVHDENYRKQINKWAKTIRKKKGSVQGLKPMTSKLIATNTGNQRSANQYSALSRNYKRQIGEELPKFITIGQEQGACNCTICLIKIPTSVYNVSGHIGGKKHKRNMAEFIKSQNQISQFSSVSHNKTGTFYNEYWESDDSDNEDYEENDFDCNNSEDDLGNESYEHYQSEEESCDDENASDNENSDTDQLEEESYDENDLDIENSEADYSEEESDDDEDESDIENSEPSSSKNESYNDENDSENQNSETEQSEQESYDEDDSDYENSEHESDESIIVIDGIWACIVCRLALLNADHVEDHIRSSYHEINTLEEEKRLVGYKDVDKLWVCKVCKRLLHKCRKETHIKSRDHRLQLKKMNK